MQDEAVMTCLELMMAAVQRKEAPTSFSFIQEGTTETEPETGVCYCGCVLHIQHWERRCKGLLLNLEIQDPRKPANPCILLALW